MTIDERIVGDITILELKGKITLGEGDEALKARVARIISSGRRKVILNMQAVPYIDSSGNGEIVRTYTVITRNGGRLALLNLTKRIEDLFSITKLLTVYDTYESEAIAIASFGSVSRTSICPVCRVPAGFGPREAVQKCANCLAESMLRRATDQDSQWVVERVELPTYQQERVVLRAEWPYVISVAGRLDLFSAEVVEQAWMAVPRPKKILIELPQAGVLATPKGWSVVASLCRPEQDGGRTTVWLGDRSAEADKAARPANESFFTARAAALDALWLADTAATRMVVEVGAMPRL